MELEWNRLPGYPGELATGQAWTYLITANDQETMAVLTRWAPQDDLLSTDVSIARQAALYAIRWGGIFPGNTEATGAGDAAVAHLRKLAQQYESGLDVGGDHVTVLADGSGQPVRWHRSEVTELDEGSG